MRGLREKCGVFGIVNSTSDLQYCILGMRTLQHRGHESAGFSVIDDGELKIHHNSGLVDEVATLSSLGTSATKRKGAIGHVRYSTSGKKEDNANVQPIIGNIKGQVIAVAHNGNLTNANTLKAKLEAEGIKFKTTMDSEVIVTLMEKSKGDNLLDCLIDALNVVEGAYALVVLSNEGIFGVRDRFAIRPLVLGVMDSAHILASESCALDALGANLIRDVSGGEIIHIKPNGEISTAQLPNAKPSRHCVFEYVYFSRPDSVIDGVSVYQMRKAVGRQLSISYPVAGADIVVPVPDSSVAAALGYAEASGLPFELGVIRNNYVTRTFIQPAVDRATSLCIKHNVNRSAVEGKSVILIDDSLVRGNTARSIITQIREFGAREVHMRIASPPVRHCCYYGIDTPDINHLVAARMSCDELAQMLMLDSLAFASTEDLYLSAGLDRYKDGKPSFCDACFTGDYPVALTDSLAQNPDSAWKLQRGSIAYIGDNCTKELLVVKNHALTLGLLRFDPVFDSEFVRYTLGLNHEKCYGVHIFVNTAAADLLGQSVDNDVAEFMTHCTVILEDNIVDALGGVFDGIGIYSKLCLIVPSYCVFDRDSCCDIATGAKLSFKVSV